MGPLRSEESSAEMFGNPQENCGCSAFDDLWPILEGAIQHERERKNAAAAKNEIAAYSS